MIEGQTIVPALDRHSFRGEFLASFAVIEDHLARAVDRTIELGLAKKPPLLFGQKFALVRKHVNDQRIWRHAAHVAAIISELERFTLLRGLIGHGVIDNAVLGAQPAFSIRQPGNDDWRARKVLSDKEARSLLDDLAQLTKRLERQALKGPTASNI